MAERPGALQVQLSVELCAQLTCDQDIQLNAAAADTDAVIADN